VEREKEDFPVPLDKGNEGSGNEIASVTSFSGFSLYLEVAVIAVHTVNMIGLLSQRSPLRTAISNVCILNEND